jgi:hypothetical protein
MTQFLLVAAGCAYTEFPDIELSPAQETTFLSEAASLIFPMSSKPIWKAAPPGEKVGDLVYEARDAVLAGEAIEDTRLGRFLFHAVGRQDSFALFYGSDFSNLPRIASPTNIFRSIEEQLRADDGSNLELYGLWLPDA